MLTNHYPAGSIVEFVGNNYNEATLIQIRKRKQAKRNKPRRLLQLRKYLQSIGIQSNWFSFNQLAITEIEHIRKPVIISIEQNLIPPNIYKSEFYFIHICRTPIKLTIPACPPRELLIKLVKYKALLESEIQHIKQSI